MASMLDRKGLEGMKRAELQRISKEHGLKANQKSEDLIKQLLDAQSSVNPGPAGSQPTDRSKHHSTVQNDQAQEEQTEGTFDILNDHHSQEQTFDDVPFHVDSRKAGARPGSSNPRALTRSFNSPRNGRGNSMSTEDVAGQKGSAVLPILAETEETTDLATTTLVANTSQTSMSPLRDLAVVDKHVADALRPLHEQMEIFKSELEQIKTLRSQSDLIRSQAEEISALNEQVQTLLLEVQDLRSEITSYSTLQRQVNHLKDILEPRATVTPPNPRTPPSPGNNIPRAFQDFQEHPHLQSHKSSPMLRQDTLLHAPQPEVVLGKRLREPRTSDVYADVQGVGAPGTPKPEPKRQKITHYQPDSHSDPSEQLQDSISLEAEPGPSTHPIRRAPAFSIFNDADHLAEEDANAPPTNNLPEFCAQSSPLRPAPELPETNHLNASEKQRPFRFSFLPPAAAPAASIFQNSFPYSEPPTSPTPTGIHSTPANQPQGKRTDVFQAFGLPPPGRPARFAGRSLGAGSDDYHTLRRSGRATSRELAVDNSHMKRTMYGTELEGDTRFGDFGVEGVGGSSNFWAGK